MDVEAEGMSSEGLEGDQPYVAPCEREHAVTQERDWPYERSAKGSVWPWFLSATGYLMVLFHDAEEACRAEQGLLERGTPEADVRFYSGGQILSIESRFEHDRSIPARVIEAMTADHAVKNAYIDNARAGGGALWLYAADKMVVSRFMRLLADYDYFILRYYGEQGVEDIVGL
jgi:hypothetical protein